jgi:hypothetical protein
MKMILRFSASAFLLGAIVACADPPPRGPASQGVAAPPATERTLNAPYYQGADPDFQRRSGSSGRP